jgi:lipase maturation factor 1
MQAASKITAFFEGPTGIREGAQYDLACWIFLRTLGLVFLIGFLSLWVQVQGLIGPDGILPAGDYLAAIAQQIGFARFWFVPTVLWLGAGATALNLTCGLGTLAAVGLLLDLWPRATLALCWVLYLSLVSVGQDFLSFQWDALLLETGLLALLIAPGPRGRPRAQIDGLALFLIWFLLFRLMFESGLVKLTSGDPTWRNLTALDYHFFTQPLPTWPAWFANLLPGWVKALGVLATFTVELGAPWLIFAGGRARRAAFLAFLLLQGLIGGTGNYTFFNLLAMTLALTLLDDGVWRRILPGRVTALALCPPEPRAPHRRSGPIRTVTALVLLLLASATLWGTVVGRRAGFPAVDRALALVVGFQSVNSYGLFRVMTTERSEIVVEGSDDGTTWREYNFRYKPGDVTRRPAFVEPHQPRLDWQMWFAALGTIQETPWFQAFLARLLQGSPAVIDLLGHSPFPGPPRYVRALLYDYRFTSASERRAGGAWWTRELVGLYCPPIHLRGVPPPTAPAP